MLKLNETLSLWSCYTRSSSLPRSKEKRFAVEFLTIYESAFYRQEKHWLSFRETYAQSATEKWVLSVQVSIAL